MPQPRLTVVYLDLTAGFAYVLKALQVGGVGIERGENALFFV